ncbi:MAG: butyrate kinase [Bacteroidetes bacterium]|nr:butyrate kinase [Bacteroidota bacterium]
MHEPHEGFLIFVVNTGSTSTKLSLFRDAVAVSSETFRHREDELDKYDHVWDQLEFRARIASDWLKTLNSPLSAAVGIGGLLKPVAGGTYTVNEAMIADARANLQGEHASNLGCAIVQQIGCEYGCPSFVVDPVSVDEFGPLARYSGHPLIKRKSLSHALNIHAAARMAAEKVGKDVHDTSFVIAHLGGGISVAPVKAGQIIDANDASSDGPFSPERTGGLPLQQFIDVCFSGDYTQQEIRKMVMGKGGLLAYLGTNSARAVEMRVEQGDAMPREIYQSMAYQIAKEIGAMATVLNGNIDAIILTGGLAGSKMLTDWIEERVGFIAEIQVYPGEDEMKSLALGVLRVLQGKEKALEY